MIAHHARGPLRPLTDMPALEHPSDFRAVRWTTFALTLLLALWGVILALNGRGADLRVYLTAGARFALGEPLYRGADGAMPFKYAPSAAAWFWPWTFLPARMAAALWNACGVAAFGFSVMAVCRWFDETRAWVVAAAALTLAAPFYFELFYGQADLLTLALLVVAVGDGAAVAAGLAFAVAVQFKPPALIIGLLWLAQRQWRRMAWALAGSALLWLPVLWRYGAQTPSLVQEWQHLLAVTSPPWVMGHNPQGLPTLLLSPFYTLDAVPPSAALLTAQLVSVALLVGFIAWRKPSLPIMRVVACFAVAFLSPLAWRANFVLAWPLALAALHIGGAACLASASATFLSGALINEGVLGAALYREVAQFRLFALSLLALCVAVVRRRR